VELQSHPSVVADFRVSLAETLPPILATLTARKILLHLDLAQDGGRQDLYFINNEPNRLAVAKIQSGEIKLDGLKAHEVPPETPISSPDIFTLYEQNIGLLTPLIADSLRDAETEYPETWIKDAIREAATANKRNWRYILRVLERWAAEGKNNGAHWGNPKTNPDPDKYVRGKYGHMVQR
jgi:DNA replication protein